MQLRKQKVDWEHKINFFVREKIRNGEQYHDSDIWAKELLESAQENSKTFNIQLYNTYHRIPNYVEVWEKRLNNTTFKSKSRKAKDLQYKNLYKDKTQKLLSDNKINLEIPFERLQPQEYKLIFDYIANDKEIPRYLKGILKPKKTLKNQLEEITGKSLRSNLNRLDKGFFYVFICIFFMCLMLINL